MLSLLLISDVNFVLKIMVLIFDLFAFALIKVSFFNKQKSAEEQRQEVKEIVKDSIEFGWKIESEEPEEKKDIRYQYSQTKKLVPNFVVLDFETTGLSAEKDCIIQVAAVKYQNFKKVNEIVTYVNPGILIPQRITEINGITNKTVKKAPFINEVLPQLIEFIEDDVIVAHNAKFDISFLIRNIEQCSLELKRYKVIDTLQLARMYIDSKNHKLETLKRYLKLEEFNSHEALHDCYVTGELYKYCYEQSLVTK